MSRLVQLSDIERHIRLVATRVPHMQTNNMTFSKVDGRWMHWHHVLFMILCGVVVVIVYIVSTHEFRAYRPGERSVEDSLYRVKVIRRETCYKLFTFAETPLNVTALASFPRSGNTWTRRMLTEATGTYVYLKEYILKLDALPGVAGEVVATARAYDREVGPIYI